MKKEKTEPTEVLCGFKNYLLSIICSLLLLYIYMGVSRANIGEWASDCCLMPH